MNFYYKFLLMFWISKINNSFCILGLQPEGYSNRKNADILLNSLELLRKYNYTSENHVVVTEDGYKLNIYRIVRKGVPILLVHGIGDSSDSWLVLGPTYSLAYQLADAGYDVWIFNARGNRYSKEHTRKISQEIYWDFSYEEIGMYDVPATVNYILYKTNHSKLTYIGFSQGTTEFYVMCSMRPEYNKKIDHAILLAPVAWLEHTKYPLIDFFSRNLSNITQIAETLKVYEAFPFNENLNLYHASVCNTLSSIRILCELELFVNFGLPKLTHLLPDRLPVITSHIPAGTSSKVFFHFVQGYKSKKFQRYDYGTRMNRELYSSTNPPVYDVSLIDVPMTLVVSEVDWFSDLDDVEILKKKLKSQVNLIKIKGSLQFTHLEFVYGSRVNSIINKPILRLLADLRRIES